MCRFFFPLLIMLLLACGERDRNAGDASPAADGGAVDTVSAPDLSVWLDYEEGMTLAESEGRHVLIDFTTSWCHWCEVMDRSTFSDEAVLAKLTADFVKIRIDAESDAPQGASADTPSGRDLAGIYGVRGYPTVWFLDPEGRKLSYHSGFVEADVFVNILGYFADKAYQRTSFQAYADSLVGS